MKKSNKKFTLLAVALLFVISIGYAALSTTLSINGTANIASNSWNVHFANIQTTTGSVTPTTAPTVSGTNTTSLTWAVSLAEPGDFYELSGCGNTSAADRRQPGRCNHDAGFRSLSGSCLHL